MSAPWEEHFDELSELDETERACRLEEIAGDDPDLARHLRKLLAADSGTHSELTEPLAARAPGFLAGALAEAGPVPERTRESDRTGERIGNYRLLSAADAREPLVEALFSGESAAAALPVAERRLETYRRILGDDHEKAGMAWNGHGVPGDDPRLAFPLHNPDTAMSLALVAQALLARRQLGPAEAAFRQVIEISRTPTDSTPPAPGFSSPTP